MTKHLPPAQSRYTSRSARQLSLGLAKPRARKPAGRGGARPGAGRPRKKDSERGFVAHRVRAPHRKDDPVHVTLRVRRGIPSLRRQAVVGVVKGALAAQKKQLSDRQAKHFHVVHFSIQDDHVHLIVEAPDKRGIARGIAGLEVRIARGVNKLVGRAGAFWSDRYHRRDLRTPTETRNVLRYVLLNFQKHRRVIGNHAFADPHSSAATFDGFARAPAFLDVPDPWPHVVPRTWLLRVGWRRRGLIDPADTPASATGAPHRAS